MLLQWLSNERVMAVNHVNRSLNECFLVGCSPCLCFISLEDRKWQQGLFELGHWHSLTDFGISIHYIGIPSMPLLLPFVFFGYKFIKSNIMHR